eukprot:scaffold762_cov363-Pavlova_lutheri.AAC.17
MNQEQVEPNLSAFHSLDRRRVENRFVLHADSRWRKLGPHSAAFTSPVGLSNNNHAIWNWSRSCHWAAQTLLNASKLEVAREISADSAVEESLSPLCHERGRV